MKGTTTREIQIGGASVTNNRSDADNV